MKSSTSSVRPTSAVPRATVVIGDRPHDGNRERDSGERDQRQQENLDQVSFSSWLEEETALLGMESMIDVIRKNTDMMHTRLANRKTESALSPEQEELTLRAAVSRLAMHMAMQESE